MKRILNTNILIKQMAKQKKQTHKKKSIKKKSVKKSKKGWGRSYGY